MKNKIFLLTFIIFLLSACNQSGANKKETTNLDSIKNVIITDSLNDIEDISYENYDYSQDIIILDSVELLKWNIDKNPQGVYNQIKNSVKKKKQELSLAYASGNDSIKKIIIKEAENYIYETLLNKIIPHWYGMSWDISGYSAVPQEGTVGCSYFVSNTLLHMGFNLNRYKIAQADATTIARSLQTNNDLIILNNKTPEYLVDYVKTNLTEGIYTIGLSCHVGYLLYRNGQVFFIHSNYYLPTVIMIEKAMDSSALVSSIYIIGKITTNETTIIKWLTNSKFEVINLS